MDIIQKSDLDITIKNKIKERIKKEILKSGNSLPLMGQEDIVRGVLTSGLIEELSCEVICYYLELLHSSVECDLKENDFVLIYFNR